VNGEFELIGFNKAAEEITQGRVANFVGKTARKMYHDQPEIQAGLDHCYKKQDIIKHQMSYPFSDEEQKNLIVTYVYLPPDLVIMHTEDITQRKRTEIALHESEAGSRSQFEDAPISLWDEDYSSLKNHINWLQKNGITDFRRYFEENPNAVFECLALINVIDLNKATLKLYNAETKEELLKEPSHRIFTEESYTEFKKGLLTFIEGHSTFEIESTRRTLTGELIHIN